jgi:hypothetical protein
LFIKGVFNNKHVCMGGLQHFNINYAGGNGQHFFKYSTKVNFFFN